MLKLKRVFESSENKGKFSWKDPDVQGEIKNAVRGIKIDSKNTTDKELFFTLNGNRGSMHMQGYMLVLDTDTDDNIPAISYPIRDKNNLTLDNVLSTIKVVLSKRESLLGDLNKDKEEKKEHVGRVRHVDIDDMDVEDDGEILGNDIECDPEDSECADALDRVSIDDSPVFHDVAKDRMLDRLSKSLLISDKNPELELDKPCDIIWVYLSPSYAVSKMSDIVLPVIICGKEISMPIVEMPDPNSVFGGDLNENALSDYDSAVQDYIINDAPISDVAVLDLDNADDIRAMLVEHINYMSDSYMSRKQELSDMMEVKGESLLKESRYFIVPEDTDLDSDAPINKLNKIGFSSLSIAKDEMQKMAEDGTFGCDLRILDTNFSNSKDKWELV